MPSISDTIARLSKMRAQPLTPPGAATNRLSQLDDFGSNPGALGAWAYIPETVSPSAPLVVVLHGCTQTAASYDLGSGWSELADRYGFALLFPEQRRANNSSLCFNWFEPGDSRRNAGEPLSIAQMIETMADRHGLDRSRIYVTGLSAGGAMASTLLATYPELFAGGAIIAGLPFGSAATIPQALERMRGRGEPDAASLAAAIGSASPHAGPWPTISIWHGTADHTVVSSNADSILGQWQAVHGVSGEPDLTDTVDGVPHRIWCDANGRIVIEDYRIAGMGHGTPLAATGDTPVGNSGPHMLEAGISSTHRIATFWNLTDGAPRKAIDAARPATVAKTTPDIPKPSRTPPPASPDNVPAGVTKVIEDALRAAGLMR